jgi:hypothetical protein
MSAVGISKKLNMAPPMARVGMTRGLKIVEEKGF